MLIDIDGNPDDTDGTDVTLALALGSPDGPEREDVADPEGVPTAVLFEEFIGSPDEGEPLGEVLFAETVGSPDVGEELLAGIVGNPDAAEEVPHLLCSAHICTREQH